MQYKEFENQDHKDAALNLKKAQLIVGMLAIVLMFLVVLLGVFFVQWVAAARYAFESQNESILAWEQAANAYGQIEFLQIELSEYEVVMKKLAGYVGHASYRSPIASQRDGATASRALATRPVEQKSGNTYTSTYSNGSLVPDIDDIISVNGKKLQYVGDWELTAYNPTVAQCDADPWTTASGARTNPGLTCAIDRRYWKFGTRFWVSGFGEVVAHDTGSKVLGQKRMDICMMDVKMARTLGRWRARVYLICDD